MFYFKRHKFMRTFLSVLLAITFLFQPLVTYATISEKLAEAINKISDAVGKVGEIKDAKFDEILEKANSKLEKDQKAYNDAKSKYDKAEKALNDASESEKESLQEKFNVEKINFNNASKDLNKTKDNYKLIEEVVKAAKGENKSAQESATSANDSSKAITGDNVEDKTKTGKMENLNASAINMQTGQETLKKAGENLAKATDFLENTSEFIGNILDKIEPITDLLALIPGAGEVVEVIVKGARAAEHLLKLASDATNILSETFLSMAEKGKTSDADFIKTLAAKSVANAPEVLYDVGSTVLDLVGLDKLMGSAGEKLKDVGSNFLKKHENVEKLVKFLNFDMADEAAKNFADNMNSGVTNFITKHITKDKEKTGEFISTGVKTLFSKAIGSTEESYKKAAGIDSDISATEAWQAKVKNISRIKH